ncbi:MAG: hypothetical protein IPJ49_30755 [Candidatus Obscuribacter sp.]|nr:hypothetical protein [Candidatus Obscuribacter sp.]
MLIQSFVLWTSVMARAQHMMMPVFLSGSQPVLSYFGELNGFVLRGCGGACSQSHGQSDLVNSVHVQASGSCCH